MPTFTPKNYQLSALQSVEAYFRECQERGDADYAFQKTTEALWGQRSYFTPLAGFPEEMPYFCLRVPTGGGKTYLAAKSVSLINNRLLHREHSVILWIVPSTAIREQTMAGLKNIDHPLRKALNEAGAVTVMDLEGAKALNRSTLETSTVVIIATRQAFQVEKEEIRKVYESSGTLMHLFDDLSEEHRALVQEEDGTISYSLANVLALRRPFVIVDEAHNNRTELGFKTLEKLRPSGIMELTATPDTTKTPSNVLHSVSAVELKRAEMIKLPIQLETEPNEQKCLALALDQREQLHEIARREYMEGAPYLRPLVLIQAEPKSKTKETKHAEWVKAELMQNHNVPEAEVVIATGSEKGLEVLEKEYKEGIFSEKCPVKYVITQKALAEGWDCPFAYVLVSLAEIKSATSIEQLLGRILRQPQAISRAHEALNKSYAFVASRNFGETAETMRDCLVESSGFNREEAVDFVAARKVEQGKMDFKRGAGRIRISPVDIPLNEEIDFKSIPKPVKEKLSWDKKSKTLTMTAPLTLEEAETVKAVAIMEQSHQMIEKAAEISRTEAVEVFTTPSELGKAFFVPELEVVIDGELRLFDEAEALDYPWDLPLYESEPDETVLNELNLAARVSEGGEIDINYDGGRVETRFLKELTRDLGLSYRPENWNEAKLAAWFSRQLHDPTITHSSKRAFIVNWLGQLLNKEGMDLARVNRQKFLLRTLLERQVNHLRKNAVEQAYRGFLFDEGREKRVRVGSEYQFEFHPDAYAPDRDYGGDHHFQKHYYPRIGEFDSEEELLCAMWLDRHPKVDYWVRNLVRKNGASFFLQNAHQRFYPDFICKLKDGTVLVVEYKGADRMAGAESNRLLGELWAELSEGKCRFIMVTNKEWAEIERLIS